MTDTLKKAEAILAETGMLDQPGAVLYSGASTLRMSPAYLLGLNPGGSGGATLRDSIMASRREHNCYLDEQWSPGGRLQPMGQAVLQRRIQDVCARLGLQTRSVPASNLVFTRSTRLAAHPNFRSSAEVCKAVHEIFIEAIQPELLITYGAIENFGAQFNLSAVETASAEHGTWQAHRGLANIGGRAIRFANFPHFSIWASDKRADVMKWGLRL